MNLGVVRMIVRLFWLGAEICLALARFALLPNRRFATRALWLQNSCRRVLRVLNIHLTTAGLTPQSGLLVCNHLSYLDIIVLSSLAPAVFVAKREVQYWPIFASLAALAGTLFVDRTQRSDVRRVNDRIRALLDNGALVVLFPEATSSGGDTVLPFKSPLLEPVLRQRHTVTAGCIRYALQDGDVRNEVCYWRDMTLVLHLMKVLGKQQIHASVSFNIVRDGFTNRKQLARRLHSEVVRLSESFLPSF
jgi:lyso-ornithine lipid O-acyltransferase